MQDSTTAAFWRPPSLEDGHPLGNLIYLGTGLQSVNGLEIEPALVDPRLGIDTKVKTCSDGEDWEPSYARCSRQLRAGYQVWLKSGRSDPEAQIGHVFLYFYGLERRAVHDVRSEPAAQAELPVIRAELERLLGLYGKHGRFHERARALVDFLAAQDLPARSYRKDPVPQDGPLDLSDQVALAQCAHDEVPLPAAWAFRWSASVLRDRLRGAPGENLAPAPLADYFGDLYRTHFGAGLALTAITRRLQLKYWPASPTFDGTLKWVTVDTSLPGLADAGAVPIELQVMVEEMADYLASHDGQLPERAPAPLGIKDLLAKPLQDWPASARGFVEAQRPLLRNGQTPLIPLLNLARAFDLKSWDVDSYQAVCEALGREGIGVHPDMPVCAQVPDARMLFRQQPAPLAYEPSVSWGTVALLLDMAGAVMAPDRTRYEGELLGWMPTGQAWQTLTFAERGRVGVHLAWAMRYPPTLESLSPRAEAQADDEALWIGEQLLSLLLTAGPVPRRGKVARSMQECIEMLGFEAGVMLTHAAARMYRLRNADEAYERRRFDDLPSGSTVQSTHDTGGYRIPAPPQASVSLDPEKIAALHQEEERLAALLEPVFTADPPADPPAQALAGVAAARVEPTAVAGPLAGKPGLLGLDAVTSGFLAVLLGKSSWPRPELTQMARERGLPLDGMLERLNEAAYEALDMPLFEEGDPLVLNPEAQRQLG